MRAMTTQLASPQPLYSWAQPTVAADWTAAMLERLPDDGWLYELVEGRVVRMPPPGPEHGHIAWAMARLLGVHLEAHGLGHIYAGEVGWDLTRRGERKDTVLASDVAVVRAERLPLPPPRRGKTYRPIAPDLVVEIASATQYRPDLADKAQHWLDRGVRLVWVIWPERREVDVLTRGSAAPRTLQDDDTLDGDDVIPGFGIPLSQVW
jgi:Uma2 family endonuclease